MDKRRAPVIEQRYIERKRPGSQEYFFEGDEMKINFSWKLSRLCLAIVLACATLSGCFDKQEQLVMDPQWSCNIYRPASEWPGKKYELSSAQEKVLELRGEPAFVRLWYDPVGEFKEFREVYLKFKDKSWMELKRSWIYLDTREEVEFISATYYEVHPLTDMLDVMCKRGDPDEILTFERGVDTPILQWTYYAFGERYKFLENRQIRKEHFQPLPGFSID